MQTFAKASHAEKIGASGIGILPNCFERPRTLDDLVWILIFHFWRPIFYIKKIKHKVVKTVFPNLFWFEAHLLSSENILADAIGIRNKKI